MRANAVWGPTLRMFFGATLIATAPLCGQEAPPTPPADATVRIEGLVLDALTQPMAGVEVVVRRDNQVIGRTRSDGSGMFVLARLPDVKSGGVEVRAGLPNHTTASSFLTPRDGVATCQLRLYDAARLSGQIVDAKGNAIADAQVIASYDRARIQFGECVATTDQDGKFTLDGVPLGFIDVRATAPGFTCGTTTVHVTGAEKGEPPVTLALTAGEGLPLRIEVTGVSGAEAESVRVRLLPYIDGSLQDLPPRLVKGQLDKEGKWASVGLPQAEYLVSLSSAQLSFEPRQLRMYSQYRGSRISGGPFEPTTDPVARFRAFRPEETQLSGRILDEKGNGIAGETLVVRAANGGREGIAVTGADGAFTIQSPLAPGEECAFFLRNSTWILAPDSASDPLRSFDKRGLLRRSAKVDPSASYEFVVKRPATVRGRLVDDKRQPVKWTRVELQETQANRMPTWMTWTATTTAKDGTFVFRVTELAEPVRAAVEGSSGTAASDPLEITWGKDYDIGDLQLAPAGTIDGVVRDEQQRPVPGARVWLRDWNLATGQQRSGSVVETVCDRSGRFCFVGVPVGGAWLQVTLRDESPPHRKIEPFEVTPGSKQTFDLVLPQ